MRKTATTIYEQLEELYAQCSHMSLTADVANHLRTGYVFSGPSYFLMGRRIGEGWYIHAAVGKGAIKTFATLMPYYLPFVGWAREAQGREIVTWHDTETIFRRIGMKLTEQQLFEKARHAAASVVAQYREAAPVGFDPNAFGGKTPSPPKPPVPPTKDDAARSLLSDGIKRKRSGYASTILTEPQSAPGNPAAAATKTLLGA